MGCQRSHLWSLLLVLVSSTPTDSFFDFCRENTVTPCHVQKKEKRSLWCDRRPDTLPPGPVILERAEVVDGPDQIPSLTILRLHSLVYVKQSTKVRHAGGHRNKQ